MDTVFESLTEPNRRRILSLLREGELPSGQLALELKLSQPNLSKHMRVLREAGLVTQRKAGQQRLYRLRPEAFAELEEWLAPYRALWSGKLVP